MKRWLKVKGMNPLVPVRSPQFLGCKVVKSGPFSVEIVILQKTEQAGNGPSRRHI